MATDELGLVATEFFGFVPDQLYHEVYAVGYNEFLTAVTSLREVLHGEFPDKKDEIEVGCSNLLASYSHHFDREWFQVFLQYCSKNIFTIPRHIPVYGSDVVSDDTVLDEVEEMRYRITATHYLNKQLEAKIQEIDKEIAASKELLVKIEQAESMCRTLQTTKELEYKLNSAVTEITSAE